MEPITFSRSLKIEREIQEIKDKFEIALRKNLNLTKVMAPLFLSKPSGLNDDLNGIERPVSFELGGIKHEVVQSLAKWKRWCLGELGATPGEGLVTDMKAIRADEVTSPIHSHFVDQWDWEKVILEKDRTIENLVWHAQAIYQILKAIDNENCSSSGIPHELPQVAKVIHSEDLLNKYPDLSAKEREDAAAKEFGAIILLGIGGKLSNGQEHDLRAPDYDDWSTIDSNGKKGLNADLIIWDSVREKSLEISSMGIRVDKTALKKQLEETDCENRTSLPYHKAVLKNQLPFTIGGGIGQSRVTMFVLRKSNIEEVQPVLFGKN